MDGNSFVDLARKAINVFLEEKEIILPPNPLPEEMNKTNGVFVTLKRGATLRGCIGTILPTQPNLGAEIIFNAISAATRDPRFSPVKSGEINKLEIIVDLLTEPEQVFSMEAYDPNKQGVIVQQDEKRGLVLPETDDVDTSEQQVNLARQRAGIGPEDLVDLFIFDVTRYIG